MTEYIVQIEDSEKNMSERFVGQLRSYPELIRCKDCKHWGGDYAFNECSLLTRLAVPKFWIKTDQDDFCSSAERKTDDD